MNLRQHQKGFTLIEILIAMGITSTVIMLMSFIYINATRLWLSTDINMKAQQQARELLSGNPRLKVMKRGPNLGDMSRPMNVPWQGILNEFQDMCILLPAYPDIATLTLSSNKVRFATEAYIQDGGDGVFESTPAAIQYGTGTDPVSDIQIGTSGAGAIFIIRGMDGKFRSIPGDTDGSRGTATAELVERTNTDDKLYGRIINGSDGIISTTKRGGSDDVLTLNTAIGAILINPGIDNRLQSILGDANGDGALGGVGDEVNPDEYVIGDVISYEFDANKKIITRIANDDATTSEIIGMDIANFSLAYSDTANLPTTTIGAVKQIFGTVTVAIPKKFGAKYATYTVTFRAHPRKLNSAFGGI